MAEQTASKPSLQLLNQIQKKGKAKKGKKIQTTVRTRDGKIFEETINADGTINRELKGKQALPDSATGGPKEHTIVSLPSYVYDGKQWVSVEHNSLGKQVVDDEKKNDNSNISKLTIVSYNVWFADINWEPRQQKLLSMLQEIDPDIVCLQEVTPRFMPGFCDNAYIQSHFELTDVKGNIERCTVSPYGVLVACNRSKNKLCMEQVNICSLASNMGRRLVSSTIRLPGAPSMSVNTVHLESLLNDLVRIDQLKDIFGTYLKDKPEAMLMGDFNFGDRTHENDHISKEFVDCWLQYKQKVTKVKGENVTGDTCGGSRYDRILLKSGKWCVDTFEIIGKVNMPSDHLGIVATLVHK